MFDWKKNVQIVSCVAFICMGGQASWGTDIISHPPASHDTSRMMVIEKANTETSETTIEQSTPPAPVQTTAPMVKNQSVQKPPLPVVTPSDVIPPKPLPPKEKIEAGLSRAIADTAYKSLNCLKLGEFYWEIGNRDGSLASGIVGNKFGPETPVALASASKWVFGAYALEKITQTPNRPIVIDDFLSLSMRAGYGERKGMMCLFAKTIGDCADKLSETKNDKYKGFFFYSPGHTQNYAAALGLRDFTADQMTAEYKKYLGDDLDFTFKTMMVAGGLETTPTVYATFLRRILSGRLKMHDFLGHDSACTSPYTCNTAIYSPAPDEWTYSYQHWVEQGRYDDGSFSSPGAFGFYPWISSDKKYYGIISRHDVGKNAAYDSQACALDMRTAWKTGVVQE